MKYGIILFALWGFFACSESPKPAGNTQNNEQYPTFSFSNEPAVMDMRDPANWCNVTLREAALVNADPKNFNRRVFVLDDAPYRVVLDHGHQSAALMLSKQGNEVLVYTSDNFPICLSNKVNFQISPERISLRYDNKRDISFDVSLQKIPGGIQIIIDLPTNKTLGLSVHRCEACS